MRLIKRKTELLHDEKIESYKNIYAINNKNCLTIRLEQNKNEDVLILLSPYETMELKRFINEYLPKKEMRA